MPLTLQSDLVRLTKLAQVGQAALPNSVAACCSNSTAATPFTSTLETHVNSAQVGGARECSVWHATQLSAAVSCMRLLAKLCTQLTERHAMPTR